MALSLVIDDTSLLLLLCIILLLAVGLFIGKAYQPLVHPLILSRQSDVSAVRHAGQSSVYRNANSPAGFEMASQPRRAISSTYDVLREGSGGVGWSADRKRTLYNVEAYSNANVFNNARSFGVGVTKMKKIDVSSLAVGVCVEKDTAESVQVILSGDVQAKGRYAPMIVAPAHLTNDNIPTSLAPSTTTVKKTLDVLFTTAHAYKQASRMPIVNNDTLFVFRSAEEVDEVRKELKNKAILFADVVQQGAAATSLADEKESTETGAQTMTHSAFWAGDAGWIEATNSSLIAGLTAQLGSFSADQQPTHEDHIFVEQAPHIESHSLRLGASSTPAGLVLALLALYTHASITASTLTSSYQDWNPAASPDIVAARPTIVFTSAHGASSLAACLCSISKRSPLATLAAHTKLAALRHGTFSKNALWDRMLFDKTRSSAGCQRVRSLFILSEGPTVGQGLLDVLRAQLGCSVRLAYLPARPVRIFDERLRAGVNADSTAKGAVGVVRFALPTAPICVSHSLDLQAFAAQGKDVAQFPAQVGPPNVTVAVKLVETKLAKQDGFSVEGGAKQQQQQQHGREHDPFGELFVRGTCLAGTKSSEEWCATNDIGTVRSNGTFVVIRDAGNTSEVDIPTLSAEYPSARRTSRIGAGGAPTRTLPKLPLLLMLLVAVVMCSDVSASQDKTYLPLSLTRRADSKVNTTFVETSITSFMNAQRASWEQGVAQSALLEYYAGAWSVFTNTKSSSQQYYGNRAALPSGLFAMANAAVNSQDSTGQLCWRITGDERPLSGSALDPAACGEVVLLAAISNGQIANGQLTSNGRFSSAARRQLDYLLSDAPRNPSGAISMRSTGESYWSDGVYMGPPFIALYGLITNNQTLLQTAYEQVRLYRDALRISSGPAEGLFAHIINATSDASESGQDFGAWLTGNAWSAAGMCRVLATIAQSSYRSAMMSEMNDLINWTNEILTASLSLGTPLMHNYINETDTFQDAGGSALIAYSTYRLASLVPQQDFASQLAASDAIYAQVHDKMGQDGQLLSGTNVVNPLTFTSPSQSSPEGMAFFVLMSAARRDYAQGNVTTLNGPQSDSNGASSLLLNGHSSALQFLLVAIATAVCATYI